MFIKMFIKLYLISWFNSNPEWSKRMVSNKLREALSQKNIEPERIFTVFLPDISCHSNHAVDEVTIY